MALHLLTPNPTEVARHRVLRRWETTRDVGRNLDCKEYDRCLDKAIRQLWDSWTCSACPLSTRATPPAVEGLHELADHLGQWTSTS